MNQTPIPTQFHGALQLAKLPGMVFSEKLSAQAVNFKHDSDLKVIISSDADDSYQAIDAIGTPKPTEVEFELTHADRQIIAAQMLGTDSALTQTAQAGAQQGVILSQLGWTQVFDASGMPVNGMANVAIAGKSEGVDFAVMENLGMVKALNVGAEGQQAITYDRKAGAGSLVLAATEDFLEFSMVMETANAKTKKHGFLWVPKIIMTPNQAMMLMDTKPNTYKFKGFVMKVPGKPLYAFKPELNFS
jgi:hypothetical protein